MLLDLGTGALVVTALAVVIHDRVVPELRRRAEVEVGEELPDDLDYRLLASNDTVAAAEPGPALHLVFQSTCPACARTLPGWREILTARPGVRSYAVGLEEADRALAYVRDHLPEALAVRPVAEAAFIRHLKIRVVPTTLVTDAGGRLAWRKDGVLAGADVDEILALLSPSTRGDRPRGTTIP